MPSALRCGFSVLVSASRGGAHSVKDCRPQGRRARPVRALCGSGSRQQPAAGAKVKPGARHEEAGGGKKPSGRKRQGARDGRKRANPLPPPASSGARPAAGGGSQNYPPTTTSSPRREGMAAEQARGRKSRQGGNGTRGPKGRGGPLAPPCGIFFAFLGGCGHPCRALRHGGPRGRGAGPRLPRRRYAARAASRAPDEPATAGPLAGRCTTWRKAGARARAPSGHPGPDAAGHPSIRTLYLPQREPLRGPYVAKRNSAPTEPRSPRPRVLCGRGRKERAAGGAGGHPRERAGPSRPEGAGEGARAIPRWLCSCAPLLDTRTLFRHDPVTNYVHDCTFILRRRTAGYC